MPHIAAIALHNIGYHILKTNHSYTGKPASTLDWMVMFVHMVQPYDDHIPHWLRLILFNINRN